MAFNYAENKGQKFYCHEKVVLTIVVFMFLVDLIIIKRIHYKSMVYYVQQLFKAK